MELIINIFVGFCIFVIGTLFGSFFSLATYRLPRHQDIVIKRSYCPKCKHNLGFFDLIPILSYILAKGKCRYCKESISIRYLLLEVVNGIIFLLFYLLFGYTLKLLVICIAYAICFVIVGSYIMKSKMSSKELNDVKLNTKRGVFISEIVIAMILFTMLLISSYVISRNYNNKSNITIARSTAVSIAIKNAEVSRAIEYDALQSYNMDQVENGITYKVDVTVQDFSEIDNLQYTSGIAKKIYVTVKYNIDGTSYSYDLTALKGKVTL